MLFSLFLVSFVTAPSVVRAQPPECSITQPVCITNLTYPQHVVQHGGNQSVRVDADVTYSSICCIPPTFPSTSESVYLDVELESLNNLSTSSEYRPFVGSVSATPKGCTKSSLSTLALSFIFDCMIEIGPTVGNGTEHVTFIINGKPPLGVWPGLLIGAGVTEQSTNQFAVSRGSSSQDLSILVTKTLSLKVLVPSEVSVTIDGIKHDPGAVSLNLPPGSHTISVSDLVYLDNMTRAQFRSWNGTMTNTEITENLLDDTTLEAIYQSQYLLTLFSPQANVTGTGWYDIGSSANFSAPSIQPMSGALGILGGKWKFKGWYENGKLFSASGNGTLSMNQPHSLTAHWDADYTTPLIILGIAIAVSVVAAYLIASKRKAPAKLQEPTEVPKSS